MVNERVTVTRATLSCRRSVLRPVCVRVIFLLLALATVIRSLRDSISILLETPARSLIVDPDDWTTILPVDGTTTTTNATHNNIYNASTIAATATSNTTSTNSTTIPTLPNGHPHAGARDADGHWNYVPDVTAPRRAMLERIRAATNATTMETRFFLPVEPELWETVCQVPPGNGSEGEAGYEVIRHVQVDGPDPVEDRNDWRNGTDTSRSSRNITHFSSPPPPANSLPPSQPLSHTTTPQARILCSIYTYDAHHDRVKAIVETWGWRCDGFFAASTQTDTDIGAVDLPHLGPEVYGNMWQKTRSMLAFMHDHYLQDFDYFYLAGDDTYLIVENLRNYLRLLEGAVSGTSPEKEGSGGTVSNDQNRSTTPPLYIGLQILAFQDILFNAGGPGYLLNRVALEKFVKEALPGCAANKEVSAEDRFLGKCLHMIGIRPIDTADIAHRQRFHTSDPNYIASTILGRGWFRGAYKHWAIKHGWRYGIDLVSTQSISFHWMKGPALMKRLHAMLYGTCPTGSAIGDAWHNETNLI